MTESSSTGRAQVPEVDGPVAGPIPRQLRRTIAEPDDATEATRVLFRPEVTGPIFVDGSGRRGRRLRRAVYVLIGLVILLLALWWVSQLSATWQAG